MKFTCPICGSHEVEEIITGATVTSQITSIEPDGELEYGTQENQGGELEGYQCACCGEFICSTIENLLKHCK